MKVSAFCLPIVALIFFTGIGCDSNQYDQAGKTEPKAETPSMPASETPEAGESATAGGALLAAPEENGAQENNEGVDHFNQEHWDVAQEHFNKALTVNPDLPEAHYNLALALDKLGNHGEATAHFKTALNLAPENPNIRDSGILKAHVGG